MRPKKILLLVNDNVQELSVMSFMLETNGYRVIQANSGKEAIKFFAEEHPDLVLADFVMPLMDGRKLVAKLKQITPYIPMILLGDPMTMAGEIHSADALVDKKNISTCELLERIKVMSARKRGPRPGTPAPPRPVKAAEILARATA